jgi:hypothetical protein
MAPWLGRARFSPPQAQPPRRFASDTREERRWRRAWPGLFAPDEPPGLLVRLIRHISVTPLAFVTLRNVDYQIYLNQILHTASVTWLAHLVCVPINVALLFHALAVCIGPSASLLLFVVLASWYAAMAATMRSVAWGLVAVLVLAGLCTAGVVLVRVAAPYGRWANPFAWMLVVSTLQAYAHLFEAHVPPRANFERHWLPLREFVWGSSELPLARRIRKLAWTPIGGVWGTFDEWYSSAKLLPFYLLELLWMCGYRPEQRAEHRARSLASLASGDPALDWIGVGGGASVAELPSAQRVACPTPTPS